MGRSLFIAKVRGRMKPMLIIALNVKEAEMKARMILESRKMLIPNPKLMPGSLKKTRRILGKR